MCNTRGRSSLLDTSLPWICYAIILLLVGVRHVTTDAPQEIARSGLDIYSLHIETDVAFRFATTKVISRLANKYDDAKEATFTMAIPKTAFITGFVMTIDGQDYQGEVKEKVKAKIQYEKAKQKGESAGKISAIKTRNTFQFRLAVNVAANSKIDFNLTYQELLQRKLGFYEYVLNINPGQVVRDVRIDVFIRESRDITEVRVPPIKRNATDVLDVSQINPDTTIIREGRSSYHIMYDPDEAAQRRAFTNGIAGQFIVQYDVARDQDAGEIQVIDGYFVHYFAPAGLEPVNKNVLFVIDVSGSMSGEKIQQTKDAMHTILDDLREGDMFNIITFATYVSSWSDNVKEVNTENIKNAKKYVAAMKADGGTNINDALLRGITYLDTETIKEWEKKPSMIIFLTDGEPTSGITSLSRILSNVREANQRTYTIFSLGFGHELDFNFLQKISLQNRALARRIYADSDAALQLEDFYNEVSTPVLSDIQISYVGDVTEGETVTEMNFPAYYRGGEIIIAGKLKDGIRNFDARIEGHASVGYMAFDTNVRVPKVEKDALQTAYSNFTEKLWAYLTIKKLLNKMLESSNATVQAQAKEKALEMSLKYSFVTPLTSMVVTKPEQPSENIGDMGQEDNDGDEDEQTTSQQTSNLDTGRAYRPPKNKRRQSFVDNDPHFIIHVNGMADAICFNVDGEPNIVYQLLHDRTSGTVINGLVVGKADYIPKNHKHPRTYIGEIMLMRNGVSVHVTPNHIIYNNSHTREKVKLKWKKSLRFSKDDTNIDIYISEKTKLFVNLGDNIVFAVLRHLVDKHHKHKVDFLGLYVVDFAGLSDHSHGLIGQFLHQEAHLHQDPMSTSPDLGEIRIHGPHMPHRKVFVKRIHRRDMDRKDHVTCWNVKNNGRGLLAESHTDYVVPTLFYKKSSLQYNKANKIYNMSKRT